MSSPRGSLACCWRALPQQRPPMEKGRVPRGSPPGRQTRLPNVLLSVHECSIFMVHQWHAWRLLPRELRRGAGPPVAVGQQCRERRLLAVCSASVANPGKAPVLCRQPATLVTAVIMWSMTSSPFLFKKKKVKLSLHWLVNFSYAT